MATFSKVTNAAISETDVELNRDKFANGAITGAYVMLFNHLMHGNGDKPSNNPYDAWGEKVKVWADNINTWFENTVGDKLDFVNNLLPVAIMRFGSAEIEVGEAAEGTVWAEIEIMTGLSKGMKIPVTETMGGIGTLGLSGNGGVVVFYYTGNTDLFKPNDLMGEAKTGSLSIGGIISAGLSGSWSKTQSGNYIIGVGTSVGLGIGFKVGGYYGTSTIKRKK